MRTFKEKMADKPQWVDTLIRTIIVIVASFVYSVCVEIFLTPANLVAIGMSSIGQVFGKIVENIWPNAPQFLKSPGIYVLLLNIPLCLLGAKYVSKRFIIFTLFSIAVQTIFMFGWMDGEYILTKIIRIDKSERLFLAIIAGIFSGAGIGIALRYGTSTGGVDIIAQTLNIRKGVSIGVFTMLLNIILAIINGLLTHDYAATLYTFIFIIINSLVVDKIHTAYNYLRVDVITKDKDKVSMALMDGIKRGCTTLNVNGAYTKEDKFDVFMIISSYELDRIRRIIKDVDPDAFIMVTPVKRIIGKFFKHTIV